MVRARERILSFVDDLAFLPVVEPAFLTRVHFDHLRLQSLPRRIPRFHRLYRAVAQAPPRPLRSKPLTTPHRPRRRIRSHDGPDARFRMQTARDVLPNEAEYQQDTVARRAAGRVVVDQLREELQQRRREVVSGRGSTWERIRRLEPAYVIHLE